MILLARNSLSTPPIQTHCLATRRTTQTHSSPPSPSGESLRSSRPRPTAKPREHAISRSTANATLSNDFSISSNTSVPSPHVMTNSPEIFSPVCNWPPLSSAFGGAMTQQRKPQVRPESVEATSKLDDALAILAAHRRDVILEAVAMSAKELLRSSNLKQSLPKVIEQIGHATGVDRVHILKIDPAAPVDEGRIRAQYFWSAFGILTPQKFQDLDRK